MIYLWEFYHMGMRRDQDRMVAQVAAPSLDGARDIVCKATGQPLSYLLQTNIYWVMKLMPNQMGKGVEVPDLFEPVEAKRRK